MKQFNIGGLYKCLISQSRFRVSLGHVRFEFRLSALSDWEKQLPAFFLLERNLISVPRASLKSRTKTKWDPSASLTHTGLLIYRSHCFLQQSFRHWVSFMWRRRASLFLGNRFKWRWSSVRVRFLFAGSQCRGNYRAWLPLFLFPRPWRPPGSGSLPCHAKSALPGATLLCTPGALAAYTTRLRLNCDSEVTTCEIFTPTDVHCVRVWGYTLRNWPCPHTWASQ